MIEETLSKILVAAAFGGFLVCATFLVSLKHQAFTAVFQKNSGKYWLLFFTMSMIPLTLILYVFTLFFKSLSQFRLILASS